MTCIHRTLRVSSDNHHQIIDVTDAVTAIVRDSGVTDGLCTVYIPHATAAITINENDDPNIGVDLLRALDEAVPQNNKWLHDRIDGNAAAHIKAAIVGPSETIPIADGRLTLGTWQNIFVCELDGPRRSRNVVVTILS